ncbi:GntR family transcriptional regulator [Bordetella ansorpii]|uniref:GntR family transcriptional regulator n=1 Tax=Bordetella ansorpii TaxID=288768 RepID=A0A157PCY5_9BORD|nr:GntR family transcriptional regulator [Bordetella ansorpii]SAI31348.1 GntR family transcriptional regulator [Bordetella ansorpii]
MTMKSVDPGLPVPLYHQLFLSLREAIFRGDFQPGSMLPSEAELEKQFGISRITVRRAIDELTSRALVRREKGRGTRVLERTLPPSGIIGSIEAMVDSSLAMGMQTEVQLLEFEYVPAPEAAARALDLERGVPVQHAIRVRKLDATPFSYLETYVPETVGRRYERHDITAQPLVALLEEAGITISRAVQTISAESATPELGRALHLAPGAPLLKVERTVYAQDDLPVEYITAWYHPQMYKYRMALERQNTQGSWKPAE